MKARLPKNRKPERHRKDLFCHLPDREMAAALSRFVARALCSRRFVSAVLLAAIGAELCLLGIGVARKLEMASEQALEAARLNIAAEEARAFGDAASGHFISVLPAGNASSSFEPQKGDNEEAGHDEAPPLPARDVATIIADETGLYLEEEGISLLPDEDDHAAQQAKTGAANHALSQEQAAEWDRLMRKAISAMVAGDMRLCILSLEQARTISPNDPALLYYYGMAYDKLLNPSKAREYYKKVFQMRQEAGKYFEKASKRLTFGFEQPAAMRGKFSFGPYQIRHTYNDLEGESVRLRLPILLAPGQEIEMREIYIRVQFFNLINGRKIEASTIKATHEWENEKVTWENNEEDLLVTHVHPPLTQDELGAYGNVQYYGFIAKLYYKGEPLDCISVPSSLILQEQRINSRRNRSGGYNGLLPDDGLVPEEEATPFSEFLEEIDPAY